MPPAPRVPCAFVLDVTAALAGAPIGALNDGLRALRAALYDDVETRDVVEVSVTTFGTTAVTVQPFTSVGRWHLPTLPAAGDALLGGALECAMNEIAQRVAWYGDAAVLHRRPWLIVLGAGTRQPGWERAARRLRIEAAEGRFRVQAIARDATGVSTLRDVAPSAESVCLLRDGDVAALFGWLAAALRRVARTPAGREPILPSPDAWRAPAEIAAGGPLR